MSKPIQVGVDGEPMIPITKPFLPDRAALDRYIDRVYQTGWLTNNGPLLQQLTERLQAHLGVEHLLLVGNGTLALQVAYRALNIPRKEGEAITTPFTFVATASSLQWEGLQPIFADIESRSLCLTPSSAAVHINSQTQLIVPVHVYGNVCDVGGFEELSKQTNIPVVYDAAHCFDIRRENGSSESVLNYGDASVLSFHATKLFHSGEGGAIVFRDAEALKRAEQIINFGYSGKQVVKRLGINAKMNELEAAMGLACLDEFESNFAARKRVWLRYESQLESVFDRPLRNTQWTANYAYFPILLASNEQRDGLFNFLQQNGIGARRYFALSLEELDVFGNQGECPIAKDMASRVLCLPLYSAMTDKEQSLIIKQVCDFMLDVRRPKK